MGARRRLEGMSLCLLLHACSARLPWVASPPAPPPTIIDCETVADSRRDVRREGLWCYQIELWVRCAFLPPLSFCALC